MDGRFGNVDVYAVWIRNSPHASAGDDVNTGIVVAYS